MIKLLVLKIEGDKNADILEHIWFELLEIKDGKFKAKLTQEPHEIANLHKGDISEYSIEDLTDWILYLEQGQITPNTIYLLEE